MSTKLRVGACDGCLVHATGRRPAVHCTCRWEEVQRQGTVGSTDTCQRIAGTGSASGFYTCNDELQHITQCQPALPLHFPPRRYLTWDSSLFPRPVEMQEDVASRGRKMVCIVDPHVKRDSSYYIFSEAEKAGHYVKNKNGNDFDGWVFESLLLATCEPGILPAYCAASYTWYGMVRHGTGRQRDLCLWLWAGCTRRGSGH